MILIINFDQVRSTFLKNWMSDQLVKELDNLVFTVIKNIILIELRST